jgi:import inner membrane translocase subunit TIM17
MANMLKAVKMRGPIMGGSFAIWGTMYSSYDCSFMYIRDTDDVWNSVAAGFMTGGTLAIRTGPKAALGAAMFGGVILGAIEGLQLVMQNMIAGQNAPQAPQLEEAPAVPKMSF